MERENEIDYLSLKNFYNFLIDLGINVSTNDQIEDSIKIDSKKKFTSVSEVDIFLKNFQNENNFYPISRNDISFSNICLISNTLNHKNLTEYHLKKSDNDMFEKMFNAVGLNSKSFFIINIDLSNKQVNNIYNIINFFIKSYLAVLKPKIIIDMCTYGYKNPKKFLDQYFESSFVINISHPSEIKLNENLKKTAWTNLKLLRTKLNDFKLL